MEVIGVQKIPHAVDSISRVELPLQADKESGVVRQVKFVRKLGTVRAEMSDASVRADLVGDLFKCD
jgi:hypothetical protein